MGSRPQPRGTAAGTIPVAERTPWWGTIRAEDEHHGAPGSRPRATGAVYAREMTDNSQSSENEAGGPRWALIIVILLVVVGAGIVALVLFGGDDDEDTSSTVAPTTTGAVDTTAPPTSGAPTTAAAPTTTPATTTPDSSPLAFTIQDIDDGGSIPTEYTCDGDNTALVVTVESSPEGTLELAFVVDDPDAPSDDPFVHWLVYGIPGDASEFTDAEDDLTYGVNDADVEGWIGPCPPDGEHEYVFTMFALDQRLGLESGLDGRELADAIADATITETEITATYERAG